REIYRRLMGRPQRKPRKRRRQRQPPRMPRRRPPRPRTTTRRSDPGPAATRPHSGRDARPRRRASYNSDMLHLTPADAATALRAGGVIAYPTEAVWGLGCDPFDEAAVLRLLAIKQRPVDKGLILIAANAAQLDGLADWDALPRERRDAVLASWPGPHTWIVPATARVPRWITGAHAGVA